MVDKTLRLVIDANTKTAEQALAELNAKANSVGASVLKFSSNFDVATGAVQHFATVGKADLATLQKIAEDLQTTLGKTPSKLPTGTVTTSNADIIKAHQEALKEDAARTKALLQEKLQAEKAYNAAHAEALAENVRRDKEVARLLQQIEEQKVKDRDRATKEGLAKLNAIFAEQARKEQQRAQEQLANLRSSVQNRLQILNSSLQEEYIIKQHGLDSLKHLEFKAVQDELKIRQDLAAKLKSIEEGTFARKGGKYLVSVSEIEAAKQELASIQATLQEKKNKHAKNLEELEQLDAAHINRIKSVVALEESIRLNGAQSLKTLELKTAQDIEAIYLKDKEVRLQIARELKSGLIDINTAKFRRADLEFGTIYDIGRVKRNLEDAKALYNKNLTELEQQGNFRLSLIRNNLALEQSIRVNGLDTIKTIELKAAQELESIWAREAAQRAKIQQDLAKGIITAPQAQAELLKAQTNAAKDATRVTNELADAQKKHNESLRTSINDHKTLLSRVGDIILSYRLWNAAINAVQQSLLNIPKAGIEELASKAALAGVFGTQQASTNLRFVRNLAEETGQDLLQLEQSYRKFATSAYLAGATQADINKSFADFGKVATVLHLTAEKTNAVYLALDQIYAKGTVQSEEIKKQLGNVLPAAVEIGAKAWASYTTSADKSLSAFIKAMRNNLVSAKEFVPKFAEAYRAIFAGEDDTIFLSFADKLQANLGRIGTQYTILNRQIFGAIEQQLNSAAKSIVSTLKFINDNFIGIIQGMGVVLVPLTAVIGVNLVKSIASVATASYSAATSITALNVSFAEARLVALGTSGANEILTASLYKVRTAALATWTALTGPVGLAVAGITAVAGALAYAGGVTVEYTNKTHATAAELDNLTTKARAEIDAQLALGNARKAALNSDELKAYTETEKELQEARKAAANPATLIAYLKEHTLAIDENKDHAIEALSVIARAQEESKGFLLEYKGVQIEVSTLLSAITDQIKEDLLGVWEVARDTVLGVVNLIKTIITSVSDFGNASVDGLVSYLGTFTGTLAQSLSFEEATAAAKASFSSTFKQSTEENAAFNAKLAETTSKTLNSISSSVSNSISESIDASIIGDAKLKQIQLDQQKRLQEHGIKRREEAQKAEEAVTELSKAQAEKRFQIEQTYLQKTGQAGKAAGLLFDKNFGEVVETTKKRVAELQLKVDKGGATDEDKDALATAKKELEELNFVRAQNIKDAEEKGNKVIGKNKEIANSYKEFASNAKVAIKDNELDLLALDRQYKDNVISITDYFAKKKAFALEDLKIQEKAIQDQLNLAIKAKDAGKITEFTNNLRKNKLDQQKVEVKNTYELADATDALNDSIQESNIYYLELTGQYGEAAKAQFELANKTRIARLETEKATGKDREAAAQALEILRIQGLNAELKGKITGSTEAITKANDAYNASIAETAILVETGALTEFSALFQRDEANKKRIEVLKEQIALQERAIELTIQQGGQPPLVDLKNLEKAKEDLKQIQEAGSVVVQFFSEKLGGAFESAFTSLVEGSTTAKEAFANFTKDILKSILQLVAAEIRAIIITKLLQSAFNFLGFGVGGEAAGGLQNIGASGVGFAAQSTPVNVPTGFASTATTQTLKEVPIPNRTSTKLNNNAGPASTNVYNLTVTVSSDTKDKSPEETGKIIGEAMIAAIARKEIANSARSGNLLNKNTRFG